METTEATSKGPQWVEDDGSGMTCIDCTYLGTSQKCGGSEKYMCEKYNYLLTSEIDKKCEDFEER